MRRPALLHIAVALLLCFAQTAAAVHGIGHASGTAHRSDPQLPHSPACELCLAGATLGGAMPAAPLSFDATGAAPVAVHHTPVSFRSRPTVSYSSRAPPNLV